MLKIAYLPFKFSTLALGEEKDLLKGISSPSFSSFSKGINASERQGPFLLSALKMFYLGVKTRGQYPIDLRRKGH